MPLIVGKNNKTHVDVAQHKHVTGFACQSGCVYVIELTFTSLGVWFEHKSLGAGAGVGAGSVSTKTIVTEQAVHQTLINVCMEGREACGWNG